MPRAGVNNNVLLLKRRLRNIVNHRKKDRPQRELKMRNFLTNIYNV